MLRSTAVSDLIARLDQTMPSAAAILAFDGDGTLWSGDVGEEVFRAAISNGWLQAAALPDLNQVAERYQLPVYNEANAQASGLFRAFEAGRLPERVACEMMAWCYAGWAPAELAPRIESALVDERLTERYFTPLLEILRWARERGHRTVVVSASPYPVVVAATQALGFAATDVAAGEIDTHEDLYTTRFKYPLPYAETKVLALKRLAGELPVLAAFGDNVFDLEMLREARVPVAVRPKQVLAARLSELAEFALLA
jgi:phosphatidylglycerophosphatase C